MSHSKLAAPRYLALDSSMLGNVARDWALGDASRRRRVRDLLAYLKKQGILVFVAFQHIEELLKHENDSVVETRLRFLASIPLMAWCSHYHGEMDLGGILDLTAYELDALEAGCHSPASVIEYVRPKLISVGTGASLVSRNATNWWLIRPYLIERLAKEREVASLTHRPLFDEASLKGVSVADLLQRAVAPDHEADEIQQRLTAVISSKLAAQGDKKLLDPANTAAWFVSQVAQDRQAASARSVHPFQAMIDESSLDPTSVSPEMDAEYIIEMAMLTGKLSTIRNYKRQETRKFDLRTFVLPPSLELWRRLKSRTAALPRASGSNITDGYLTSFALYVDFFQADKRTTEFIRQIRKDGWIWGEVLTSVFLAGGVDHLLTILRGMEAHKSTAR
jgi:hypothetical protein